MRIPLMQRPRNQQDNVVNLIGIRNIIEEFGEIANGLGTKVIEFMDEFFCGFVGNDGGGDGARDVGEKVAVFCCGELEL